MKPLGQAGIRKEKNLKEKFDLSPDCTLSKEYLGHNLGEHCLEDTGEYSVLPTEGKALWGRPFRRAEIRRHEVPW